MQMTIFDFPFHIYYNVYRCILVIHMVKNGESIAKTSKNINISRKTGERWVKEYLGTNI